MSRIAVLASIVLVVAVSTVQIKAEVEDDENLLVLDAVEDADEILNRFTRAMDWKLRAGKREDPLWKLRTGKRDSLWKLRSMKRDPTWKLRAGKRAGMWKLRSGKRSLGEAVEAEDI